MGPGTSERVEEHVHTRMRKTGDAGDIFDSENPFLRRQRDRNGRLFGLVKDLDLDLGTDRNATNLRLDPSGADIKVSPILKEGSMWREFTNQLWAWAFFLMSSVAALLS